MIGLKENNNIWWWLNSVQWLQRCAASRAALRGAERQRHHVRSRVVSQRVEYHLRWGGQCVHGRWVSRRRDYFVLVDSPDRVRRPLLPAVRAIVPFALVWLPPLHQVAGDRGSTLPAQRRVKFYVIAIPLVYYKQILYNLQLVKPEQQYLGGV